MKVVGPVPGSAPSSAYGADSSNLPLEAVMNSIRNGLGMRKTRIAKTIGRSWNPHFYGVLTQVHDTL